MCESEYLSAFPKLAVMFYAGARKIKKALPSVHIFITSDERQDTEFIRKKFYEWRRRSAE